jgi:uncharacterized protein
MTSDPAPARHIAVVGAGVAGLTAAHIAARTARVTLYEADPRLGGHADTHHVDGLAIDTGFIVHNERTYPTLLRLFAEVGVETQLSEMSMSVRDEETGLEYAGALGVRGLFPSARNLMRPGYLRIARAHRPGRRGGRAGLAALPGGGRAGVPRRPDGGRPDPGRAAGRRPLAALRAGLVTAP